MTFLNKDKDEATNYWLDLSKSYNVNMDVERTDLTIFVNAPQTTIKVGARGSFGFNELLRFKLQVLTVAIAQADSWFLSVKLKNTTNDENGSIQSPKMIK